SPMPNRLLISETGVSVSPYSRVTSRSCSSESLRRVPVPPSPPAAPSDPDRERDVSVSITTPVLRQLKGTSCRHAMHTGGCQDTDSTPCDSPSGYIPRPRTPLVC